MMNKPFSLFEVFGIELEYMIVDGQRLNVLPICDRLLEKVAGKIVGDIERDDLGWSNELALHVVELKTNEPANSLVGLAAKFQNEVKVINELLSELGGRLMPTAMHPWMNPELEMRLWPHEYNQVYEAFNRIFDCRGHGWSNLQSVHINLPFANDDEFGRLHAAIRLILPLLPALAASSPIVDRQLTGIADNRLEFYRNNSAKVRSLTARVIPEQAFTREAYEQQIFQTIYRDIAPYDPQGVLQNEWLNARGAIARFDRNAIEIRVLDIQECPEADLAICHLIVEVLRALVAERWTSTTEQQSVGVEPLADLFLATLKDAEQTVITDSAILSQWGWRSGPARAGEIWRHLVESLGVRSQAIEHILSKGTLSRRIEHEVRSGRSLESVYGRLCDCLAVGQLF